GKPHVAHTSNLVPLIIIDPLQQESMKPEPGKLADLAPTILAMLNVPVSKEMNGNNLLPDITWHQGRKILLIILDGWGEGRQDETNPVFLGQTPFWDEISSRYPHTSLAASGEAVGLQTGKPGNSEAGHMNIGAGHVVLQDDARLDMAMKDGSFYTNTVLLETIEKVLAHNSKLHLIGLLTEKSSHGSIDYPLAILRMAKERNLENVYLHLIFDGRSTEPGSAPLLLEKLERQMQDIGLGQIATGVGRGIALDRGGNYGKVKIAYDAMVNGIGKLYS
ncbi:MAG: hypothetical protein MUO40_02120, partial [Anaerolineaceae bacterium]|nr:hypothetical protein [Anaerolineaceae bacterium]